jgi:ectoine hydroxylase-related dioxygenase (phytanoyl-CoA dioxygenase family)
MPPSSALTTELATEVATAIERDGYTIVPNVVDAVAVATLLHTLDTLPDSESVRRRSDARGSVYAVRNLLDVVPEVRELAASNRIRALVKPILGPDYFVVRGILFDKTPGANWKVAWHQDVMIAVRERIEVEGFGSWSQKAGVTHVQPPVRVLQNMLTVRLHLDDCDADNGPLQVIPGSHGNGRLDAQDIAQWREKVRAVFCPVPGGGALLMRPLLLHASSASRTPRHRRVIHLEFAAAPLPGGLKWHSQTN